MSRALETNVRMLTSSIPKEAFACAAQEATVSAGAVVEIGRVDFSREWVTYWGLIPILTARARFPNEYSESTSAIITRPILPCTLYTTWSNLLLPFNSVGFLTINNFGSVVETRTIDIYLDDYQDRESVLCGFKFERVLFSLPDTHSFGVVYCEKCGCIIPRSRLIAVNGARRCVNCLD